MPRGGARRRDRTRRARWPRPQLPSLPPLRSPTVRPSKVSRSWSRDFDVTLRLDDGSTQTWARDNGIPKVDLNDPLAGHVEIMKNLKDSDMHNLTAYLATLK